VAAARQGRGRPAARAGKEQRMRQRVFATCDIGGEALDRLRERYELEVYPETQPPPRALVLDRVRSGIAALVTTLRDRVDEEVFAVGAAAGLKVVAQMAVGFDNIDRASANRHRIPFTNTSCSRPSSRCAATSGRRGTRGSRGSATRSRAAPWR
jgi:hypothetical protein